MTFRRVRRSDGFRAIGGWSREGATRCWSTDGRTTGAGDGTPIAIGTPRQADRRRTRRRRPPQRRVAVALRAIQHGPGGSVGCGDRDARSTMTVAIGASEVRAARARSSARAPRRRRAGPGTPGRTGRDRHGDTRRPRFVHADRGIPAQSCSLAPRSVRRRMPRAAPSRRDPTRRTSAHAPRVPAPRIPRRDRAPPRRGGASADSRRRRETPARGRSWAAYRRRGPRASREPRARDDACHTPTTAGGLRLRRRRHPPRAGEARCGARDAGPTCRRQNARMTSMSRIRRRELDGRPEAGRHRRAVDDSRA